MNFQTQIIMFLTITIYECSFTYTRKEYSVCKYKLYLSRGCLLDHAMWIQTYIELAQCPYHFAVRLGLCDVI